MSALLSLLSCAPSGEVVRIGTYNLRRAVLDNKSPDNNWEKRQPRLIASILKQEFDICGLQEVDTEEQESIPRLLAEAGAEYGSFFFGPYSQDGVGTKAHGIIWKKDRFEAGEPHIFWVSEPPELMQVNDTGSSLKGRFIRGGFIVILTDRQNGGARYAVMVTHAPLNRGQHAENAHVYVDMERKYNPEGLPSFFLGDLNAQETDDCSATYRAYWTDSYHAFDKDVRHREGSWGTFNGWNLDLDPETARRIDFIYYKGDGVKPLRYRCDDERIDGLYASDHFPVWVDFRIPGGKMK